MDFGCVCFVTTAGWGASILSYFLVEVLEKRRSPAACGESESSKVEVDVDIVLEREGLGERRPDHRDPLRTENV